jgi:hypothetical protein
MYNIYELYQGNVEDVLHDPNRDRWIRRVLRHGGRGEIGSSFEQTKETPKDHPIYWQTCWDISQ